MKAPWSSLSYAQFGVASPFDPNFYFVTSPFLSPIVLGAVRLLFAVYALATTITALVFASLVLDDANSFLSYFTHLSYIGLVAYFWAAGVQTMVFALRGRKSYPLQTWPRVLQLLHVLLHASAIVLPILVTIVFWTLLSSPTTFGTPFDAWSNVSQHALNTVFALFEIAMTHAGPSPWTHLVPLVLVLALYLAVAYLTAAAQGIYTYSFLDPHTEGTLLAAYIVGIGLGCAVVFGVVKGMCHARRGLSGRYGWFEVDGGSDSGGGGGDGDGDGKPEGLEEWQEVPKEEGSSMCEA